MDGTTLNFNFNPLEEFSDVRRTTQHYKIVEELKNWIMTKLRALSRLPQLLTGMNLAEFYKSSDRSLKTIKGNKV